MVDIEPVMQEADKELLFKLISEHIACTGSDYAAHIIRDWTEMLPQFVKVMPIDYRRALERLQKAESKETETVAPTEEVFR